MTRTTTMLLLLVLAAASPAGCADGEGVATLKVDLEQVVRLGRVEPVDGVTMAGQPDVAALKVFAENGYVAVIDLRTKDEDRGLDEPAVVAGLGMEYVSMPIDRDDITIEKARELDALLDAYDEPVLLHCASSNRIGALIALNFYDETGDAELALEMGRAAGMKSLEPLVRKMLGGDRAP